jgi:DNA replication and repair protein RecF
MFLERLALTDFRNYAGLRLELTAPLTVLSGANAQGKTNLLEAVALLALARSPRCAHDGEMVRAGAAEAVVRGEIGRRVRPPVAIGLTLRRDGGKSVRVDGQPRARLGEAIGELAVVYFGPGDLKLVSGSPGDRREFLNTCLGQCSPSYLAALAAYRGVLRQRTALLRAGLGRRVDENLLLALDDGLSQRAAELMSQRAAWVAQLALEAAEAHGRLTDGRESLAVVYQPHLRLEPGADPADLAQAVRRGLTLAGPHRDDLKLSIDGLPARTYGSQGQQRTAALALKVAELRVMSRTLGESPLLLLDDVLSELDRGRRAQVLALGEEAEQVLLTCSNAEDAATAEALGHGRAACWTVVAGTIREDGGTVRKDGGRVAN